jgi:hypothetical protein
MKRLVAASLALVGSLGIACYEDDTLLPAAMAPTTVLLTDDPFPFDTVGSVNVYVSRIEASSRYPFDTTAAAAWVEIAAPKKRFDLLTLQQGATAFLGEGTLSAGQYSAIRMTIDADSSSIKYADGADALVDWGSSGEIPLYAQVESPLAVSAVGAEIVIDFDVGRSFQYNLYGAREFTFFPWLRAVNRAATGSIAGTVSAAGIGGQASVSLPNADVTVYGGDPAQRLTWYVVATGHTDPIGHYTIAFLQPGSYIVRIEQPGVPTLASITTTNVSIIPGATTPLSVVLPPAGAGGAFLNISGSSTVGVGGTIVLRAAVGDAHGDPIPNPTISWSTPADSIVVLVDSSYADSLAFVLGLRPGTTWVTAQSGTLSDSVEIEVLPSNSGNPVASLTVSPANRTLAVGDSAVFTAVVLDAAGTALANRQVSWFLADSSGVVDFLVSIGPTAVIRAKHGGQTSLRATSEGKVGSASITVQ